MSNSFYHERYCLTKRQGEVIAPLLPVPKAKGRPCLNPLTLFNVIVWILSSGATWSGFTLSFWKFEQYLSQIPAQM